MKKTLMALALSMAVSASCFAAGASGRFATEERTADALVDALTGSTGYEQVSKSFSQGLKEKLNAAAFTSSMICRRGTTALTNWCISAR